MSSLLHSENHTTAVLLHEVIYFAYSIAGYEIEMDPYLLNLFLHLSDSLHFGRTSRVCNISPSGLSRAIKRLEQEVGQELFDRDRRHVKLTSGGALFREYAVGVLEKWSELKNALQEQKDVLSGEISLFCSVTASYSLLSDILGVFRRQYPLMHIRLLTGDEASAIPAVINGDVDVSIAARPDNLPDNLEFAALTKTSLVFIASGGELSISAPENDNQWSQVPMVLPERNLARVRVNEWFDAKGLEPMLYAQVEGNEAIIGLVSLGYGIGVVPKLVLESSPLRSRVRILNVLPELPPYIVGLCMAQQGLHSPGVRALWQLFAEDS
jgi:LysR family positive regulator for ilvC